MSIGGMLERRLLWLSVALKALFWFMVMAILVIGIRDVATGERSGPPMTLVWALIILAALQFAAWLAWYLLRRARLTKGEP